VKREKVKRSSEKKKNSYGPVDFAGFMPLVPKLMVKLSLKN
jgi:hypothetical protein